MLYIYEYVDGVTNTIMRVMCYARTTLIIWIIIIFIRVVIVLRSRPNEGDTSVVDDEGITRGMHEDVYVLCVRISMTCKWILLYEE